ncbi:MAG TPA: hypothetical protein VGG48_19720 [Rhizomicrobium sp.]|jgi:hypothetical protein
MTKAFVILYNDDFVGIPVKQINDPFAQGPKPAYCGGFPLVYGGDVRPKESHLDALGRMVDEQSMSGLQLLGGESGWGSMEKERPLPLTSLFWDENIAGENWEFYCTKAWSSTRAQQPANGEAWSRADPKYRQFCTQWGLFKTAVPDMFNTGVEDLANFLVEGFVALEPDSSNWPWVKNLIKTKPTQEYIDSPILEGLSTFLTYWTKNIVF